MSKKFCTRCGKQFAAIGREVICPACKQAAAEEAKRAAVLRAKRASWNGESVPVRISGRASTVIRNYGAANNMPFAAALDGLLKASDYFKGIGQNWEDVEPYKSRRMKKSDDAQEAQEDKQDAPQEVTKVAKVASKAASKPQEVTKATKVTSKAAKRNK